MRARMVCVLSVVWIGCDACDDGDDVASLPIAQAVDLPDVIAPRAVATDHAFDLIRVGEGAVFVWSPPFTEGGGVRLLRLDSMGTPVVLERPVFAPRGFDEHPPDAFEVRAAAGGGRLVVSWVQREPFDRRSYVAFGPDSGEAFSEPEALAPLSRETDPIGAVAAAAASDGTLGVMYRGEDTRCPGGGRSAVGRCARLGFRQVGSSAHTGREELPLVVPAACRKPLVGYLATATTWYYALCSGTPESRTTMVYAIEFEPPYAHAEEALRGATPLGLGPYEDGAVVIGEGTEGVGALLMMRGGREIETLSDVVREVRCEDGRPRLVMATSAGERDYPLRGPVDRLAVWLPPLVAPSKSHAVWTGDALLVAVPSDGDVAIHRFQCRFGRFERNDML